MLSQNYPLTQNVFVSHVPLTSVLTQKIKTSAFIQVLMTSQPHDSERLQLLPVNFHFLEEKHDH